MGYNESHKPDHAAHRHHGTSDERNDDDGPAFQQFDIKPQADSCLLALGKQIKRPCRKQEEQGTENRGNAGKANGIPPGTT